MAGELSMPTAAPAPSRSASAAVRRPSPQPRSTTVGPSVGRTSPAKSQNGCSRSTAKRLYCAGSQVSTSEYYLDVKIVAMEDEVDRLVAGWRRALPDVDVSPLEVLSRVTRLARHLDRERTAVFATHDLETWS